MDSDSTVIEILLRYESLCALGEQVEAADLCRDHPELLSEVQEGVRKLKAGKAIFGLSGERIGEQESISDLTSHLPQINGYEVTEELGVGGMGVVYKARQVKLNRFVALKMILPGRFLTQSELNRFRKEAESIAGIVSRRNLNG